MEERLKYNISKDEPKSNLETMNSKRMIKEINSLLDSKKRPEFITRVNFLIEDDVTSPLILELSPDKDSNLHKDLIQMNIPGIKIVLYFNDDKNVSYPFIPPLVRIVYPRFLSGRVFGGAICTDLLYTGGWSPSNSIVTTLASLLSLITKDEKTEGRLDFYSKKEYTWNEFIDSRQGLGSSHSWETKK